MFKSRKFAALVTIISVFSFFATTAGAQEEEENPQYLPEKRVFSAGAVLGINQSQVDGDYFAGYYKTGVNVGGIVYAHVAKSVALSMEILYSQKGSMSDGPQFSPYNGAVLITNYAIKNNYAEVPVMINYIDNHKSSAGVGLSVSRLVSSSELVNADSFNTQYNVNFNQQYPFKKTGLDFLAGANLHMVKGLYLNLRFQYSVIPIRTALPPLTFARADQYNNMWVIRLMYLFD